MKSIIIRKDNNIISIKITQKTKTNNNETLINLNDFKNNKSLLINYINRITNKDNVYTLVISNKLLLDDIISIIQSIKYITVIIIDIKILLDNNYIYKLLESNNIKIIKCYEINSSLFNIIDSNDRLFITTNEVYNSHIYQINNIKTSSLIYYKTELLIDNKCSISDIEYFLNINNYLTSINILYYDNKIIKKIINLLIKNNKHDIIINLNIDEGNSWLLRKSIKFLRRLQKEKCDKYKIDINSNYSNDYKEKYFMKELNNVYLKTSMIIIFITIIISFGIIGYYEYKTNKAIDDVQNISGILDMLDNSDDILINSNDEQVEVTDNVQENNTTTTTTSNVLTEDFDTLLSINPEFVGWLKINNTNVNYPVVKHEDNNYYLKHNFYNKVNNAGWVFMDYRNEIDNMDQNTIIYGHSNTINDTMFGSLYKVLNKSWYTNKNNQIIKFNSLYSSMQFQIFAIYVTNPEYYYIWTNFYNNEDRFNEFISEVKQKSIYDFNTDVSINDKILTISTCYNHGKERIAIHAKQI